MKRIISLGTFILFFVSVLFADKYYVDAVNGTDSNNGKSNLTAWKTVEKVNATRFLPGDVIHFKAGHVWRESLSCQSGSNEAPITYTSYGEGAKPLFLASIDLCNEKIWLNKGDNRWCLVPELFPDGKITHQRDIGNIILIKRDETKKIAGWKRWGIQELKRQGDFYHDLEEDMLYFYSDENPALIYSQIEAAMKQNIFSISNCEHLIVDGLCAAYTGAHGLAGENSKYCIIRNCDFVWIGGSHLYTKDGHPTRYGNGIEFWNGAQDNLVENCYFEEIYDVAMTNQGPEPCLVQNIIWKNNKTYRCEQAYEFWFSNKESRMLNVVFSNNECVDSGFGWSHEQRPNKNGTHLLAYSMESKDFDIQCKNNVFNNAKNTMIWYTNVRLPEAHLDNNIYIQNAEDCHNLPLFKWGDNIVSWKEYRNITGNDENSIFECKYKSSK